MKKEAVLYLLGTLALVFSIGVAAYVSPGLRARLPFSKGAAVAAVEVEPVLSGQNAEYYRQRRAEIREKISRLGDAPKNEEQVRRLNEELSRANFHMALADDADFSERYQSLEICAQTFQLNGDVYNLELLKKELEAKNWDEREKFRLVHLVNAYLLKTKIFQAARQKKGDRLKSLIPELENIAIEEGESVDSVVSKDVASFVDPIATFDKALGDEAKRTMRRGFYRSKRRSSASELNVEYEPEKVSLPTSSGEEFVYDKTLLDVPQDETSSFYRLRINDLKNLALRVPANDASEAIQKLRDDVKRATFDAYEYSLSAVDLLPGGISGNAAPNYFLDDSCKVLAEAGEIERLERLSEREEIRDVVGGYLLQARAAKATKSNAVEDANAALDESLQWALDAANDAEVVDRLDRLFKELETVADTDEKKAALADVKKKFRDAFQNAEKRSKRRLAYIDALQ